MIPDPHQHAAIQRAQRRLEELRVERSGRRQALEALEAEYEQARAKLDALSGRERPVPAYRRDESRPPRRRAESVEDLDAGL